MHIRHMRYICTSCMIPTTISIRQGLFHGAQFSSRLNWNFDGSFSDGTNGVTMGHDSRAENVAVPCSNNICNHHQKNKLSTSELQDQSPTHKASGLSTGPWTSLVRDATPALDACSFRAPQSHMTLEFRRSAVDLRNWVSLSDGVI